MIGNDTAADRAAALAESKRGGWFRDSPAVRWVTRTVDTMVGVALPPVCAGCGASGHWVCPPCDRSAARIDLVSACQRCGAPQAGGGRCERCEDWSQALAACRSAYVFDGVVRRTIHQLKYRGEFARSAWCGTEISRLMIELGWQPDLIVPVPLHQSRLRSRGYNQSAKIAAFVSSALGVPWGNVVSRTRATVSQVGLDAQGRRENVGGAFTCSHVLVDLDILLIDDVVTTGATLTACADACRSAGARTVRAVTVATGS